MRYRKSIMAAPLMLLVISAAAQAEPSVPTCDATPSILDKAQPLTAARTMGGNPAPLLSIGQAATLILGPADKVIFVAPLGKPVAPGDQAGLARLHIALGGTYRVATGSRAWIDLVQAGRPMPSLAHAHGAPCSGIAKMVDFALPAGDYILQISASRDAAIPVLVTQQP